jgi:hypothetical protein
MKVKELMEFLSHCPQDAEVFSYNSMHEDDMVVRSVATHLPHGNYDFPYGCQGDSWLEEHFMENGPQPVVFLTDRVDIGE